MPLRIREFDPEKEDWRDYIEQVEQYFVAHDLNEDAKEPTKRALFLSGVGSTTYVTLKSLLAPAKPADKTFDVIVSTLTKHYSPPPSEVVQSYRFFTRVRQSGETVSAFVAALRRLAKDCNFGDTMERILRDKIVFSINDEVIQKKLLDEPNLTYKLQTGTRVGWKCWSRRSKPKGDEDSIPTRENRANAQSNVEKRRNR